MQKKLRDIVQFRGDRLFDGAVNIDWLGGDENRAQAAARAFVFHGPAYHGVSQSDIGDSHGHRLQDTATFARSIVRRCYGAEEQSFTLAIAGYGTGKSHLALTLGDLLRKPTGETAATILSGIEGADAISGREIRTLLSEAQKPCLVVALNGMQNFDLAGEVTRQITSVLKFEGLDSRPLNNLRPRFAQAGSLIQMAMTNPDVADELTTACDLSSIQEILARLEQQDDQIYSKVYQVFSSKSIKLSALGGESVRDVIDVVTREYCGEGKPFKSLVVLFDEFGRYTEFAAGKSHVAGSGALQSLFEGIQNNTKTACFIGLIQYELNAYVQRVAPEHRAEITRYVTRYQSASRVYLSINLETLIASLIEKKQPTYLDTWFGTDESLQESKEIMDNVARWFPQSANHQTWNDPRKFHTVIRKGCWPLSAYSTWFLFHLASAGKHLQERSALTLLRDAFNRFDAHAVDENKIWSLSAVDLWSNDLKNELLTSEDGGQQGSITHAYSSIEARHSAQFNSNQLRILRAIVLASKMGLKVSDEDDAIEALAEMAGLHLKDADAEIKELRNNFNVLEWDLAFKAFDILGDAVPRSQFLAFMRQRVASTYDEEGKSKLFAGKAATWCDLLNDLDCDFAEENKISTREWRYQSAKSNLDFLLIQMKQASNRWLAALGADEPRGTIIYCYVQPSRDIDIMEKEAAKYLRGLAKTAGVSALPILVVMLYDEDGGLGQALAELSILDESISEQERLQFGNLIAAHQEKTRAVAFSRIEGLIKQRRYVSAFKDPFESTRLSRVGTEMFTRIYKHPMAFPFDGFSTARGNAASDSLALTSELLQGRLDWNGITAKPIRIKNRAVVVLQECWGIFAQNNGSVKTRPAHPVIRSLSEKWDEMLSSNEKRITLNKSFRELCAPPYGANLASAGLFLGVFLSPRLNKITIVRAGKPIPVNEWLSEGIFRGNFIDLDGLSNIELLHLGDASSEWDDLLDEWEQAESHVMRKNCYIRSADLKERIPIPPMQAYRELHLAEMGKTAFRELKRMDKDQNDALEKIESGTQKSDVALISWGASNLRNLAQRMIAEKPLWSDHEIEGLEPYETRARQVLIQIFPDWLHKQIPNDGTPRTVGDFDHRMKRTIGRNLQNLELEDQFAKLVTHTNSIIKQVESISAAHQTAQEVMAWIVHKSDVERFVRVADLRSAQQEGKDYESKIKGLASRIQVDIPKLNEARIQLSTALTAISGAIVGFERRAKKIRTSQLGPVGSMSMLQNEVEALIMAFEGCTVDLPNLHDIRGVLRTYQQNYTRLSDRDLSWDAFEALAETLKSELKEAFGEMRLPWSPVDTIVFFAEQITRERERLSELWIESLLKDAALVSTMQATEANRLHTRASNPPAVLAEMHAIRLSEIIARIEKRLDQLKIDWLIEKFNELSPQMRSKFVDMISNLL